MNLNRRMFFSFLGVAPAVAAIPAVAEKAKQASGASGSGLLDAGVKAAGRAAEMPYEVARDIVVRAMQYLGILAIHEESSLAELLHGLKTLKDIVNADPKLLRSGARLATIHALAAELAPTYGRAQASNAIPWHGDPFDIALDFDQYMAQSVVPAKDLAPALMFYEGHQWDPFIQEDRLRNARACLVINKLPLILGQILRNTKWLPSAADCTRLAIAVAHRNMDAQRLYNYMASVSVEKAPAAVPSGYHYVWRDEIQDGDQIAACIRLKRPYKLTQAAQEYERERKKDAALLSGDLWPEGFLENLGRNESPLAPAEEVISQACANTERIVRQAAGELGHMAKLAKGMAAAVPGV